MSVDGSSFVPEVLTRALKVIVDTAEAIRTDLRQRFARRITFEDETAPRPGGTPDAVN